jgi:hypothetical protein
MESVLSILAGVGGAVLIALVAYFTRRSTKDAEIAKEIEKSLQVARDVVKKKADDDISDLREILSGENPEEDLAELLNKE